MKILITGASGYCGHFLAMHFANKGIPVVGLDLAPHPVIKNTPNYTFAAVDIRSREVLEKIFEKEMPTHVIHLAYLMDPHFNAQYEYDVDVMGSKYAFEIANATPSVKQFILMSSASIYGGHPDNPEWLTEEDELRPHDYNYAIYKKEIEAYYHAYEKRDDMKLVIFRMCTAVGPSYYKPGGVVSTLVNAPFLLDIFPGDGRVQFIHEADVIGLFDKVVHDNTVEDTFNLAPDSYSTTKLLGMHFKKKFLPMPLFLLKIAFGALFKLRVARLTPAIARLMAFGIIVSPKKLMDHYHYRFKFSTETAFLDAVETRRQNGTL